MSLKMLEQFDAVVNGNRVGKSYIAKCLARRTQEGHGAAGM
jgi:hypothetical protein